MATAKPDTLGGATGPTARYGVVGVEAALKGANAKGEVKPTIFSKEFSLADRVALVTGGNRGLGLEMAVALVEAGCRAVYCADLPEKAGDDFLKAKDFTGRMKGTGGDARLEYVHVDVTKQDVIWKVAEQIADKEGRFDICVAAAGMNRINEDCLETAAKDHEKIMQINCNGVLYTAQAAGRQMRRFNSSGSIVLIASMSGSVQNKGHQWLPYNTSKSAVLQMARTMACELGPEFIRVNTISPGYINTDMTRMFYENTPGLLERWREENPQQRIGRPEELRGLVVWLASDASTYVNGSDIIIDGGHTAW